VKKYHLATPRPCAAEGLERRICCIGSFSFRRSAESGKAQTLISWNKFCARVKGFFQWFIFISSFLWRWQALFISVLFSVLVYIISYISQPG
jgi:hypothetical protein